MFSDLPKTIGEAMGWGWDDIHPYYENLLTREITKDSIHTWMRDWTHIHDLVDEIKNRLYFKTLTNTADEEAKHEYKVFSEIFNDQINNVERELQKKLAESEIEPENFKVPLRRIKSSLKISDTKNQKSFSELDELTDKYIGILNKQSIDLNGKQISTVKAYREFQNHDRKIREEAWRKIHERQSEDYDEIDEIWKQMILLRTQIARESGYKNFIEYQLAKIGHHNNYSLKTITDLHAAIVKYVVPGANRMFIRKKDRLGLDSLRPWDVDVNPKKYQQLTPFSSEEDLISKTKEILEKVDPKFAEYYQIMIDNNALDLIERKHKATTIPFSYPVSGYPVIVQALSNTDQDLQYHLFNVGYAINYFEKMGLPYWQQRDVCHEISETVSLTTYILTAMFFEEKSGGVYSERDAARSRINNLERLIIIWPQIVMIERFHTWVYEHPELSIFTKNCDRKWKELSDQYIMGIDYDGLEEQNSKRWRNLRQMIRFPSIGVEYSLAYLAAIRIWENFISDPESAIEKFKYGMSMGSTKTLPQVLSAMGSRLTFDEKDVLRSVAFMLQNLVELEEKLQI